MSKMAIKGTLSMNNLISIFAHVKWFNNQSPPTVPGISPAEALLAVAIVVVAVGGFWFINAYLDKLGITKKLDATLKPLRNWVPTIVRVTTALLLFINVAQGYLVAPNVLYDSSSGAVLARGLFMAAAVLLLLGFLTEIGAVLLLAGYVILLSVVDPVDVLDHFEYIAVAGYLFLRGPGLWSLDHDILKRRLPLKLNEYRHLSLPVYRIGIGIGLSVLALSEKLLNFTIAQDFLNQYDWNLLSLIGLGDRWFIVVAGAMELAVGLALIFNFASRLALLIVLGLMTITAILLGIDEVYGHLFAVGIVVAVWVNDRQPNKT